MDIAKLRELGLQIQRFLKFVGQVDMLVKKTYGMPIFTSRDIEYRNREVIIQPYKILVIPHLEYCVQL